MKSPRWNRSRVIDTPLGRFAVDPRLMSDHPLDRMPIFADWERSPIYEQLRRETGLDPAPSWPEKRYAEAAAELHRRVKLSMLAMPIVMDPGAIVRVTSVC